MKVLLFSLARVVEFMQGRQLTLICFDDLVLLSNTIQDAESLLQWRNVEGLAKKSPLDVKMSP